MVYLFVSCFFGYELFLLFTVYTFTMNYEPDLLRAILGDVKKQDLAPVRPSSYKLQVVRIDYCFTRYEECSKILYGLDQSLSRTQKR